MKKFLLTIFAFIFFVGLTESNAQITLSASPSQILRTDDNFKKDGEKNISVLTYCSGSINNGVGVGAPRLLKAAAQFPATKMTQYKDQYLTCIRVGLQSTEGTEFKVFVTKTKEGTPIYIQNAKTTLELGWNYIYLDTPYKITGEEIYIGYQIKSEEMILGVCNASTNQMGNWIAIEETWSHLTDSKIQGNVAVEGLVSSTEIPDNDANIISYRVPKFAKVNVPFKVNGSFLNSGMQTITNYDLDFEVNGTKKFTTNISGVSIARGAEAKFESDQQFTLDAEGEYTIKVIISKINGNSVTDLYNGSGEKTITVLNDFVQRKVLLEHFTTEKCTYCPKGHALLEEVVGDNPNIIWIAHHSGFGTDQYTIPEDNEYLWFYKSSSFAPAMMVDRANWANQGAAGGQGQPAPGPVFGISTNALIDNILTISEETPSFITVDLKASEQQAENGTIKFKVSGKTFKALEGSKKQLTVFVTEDGLKSNSQSGASGTYTHNHVLREVLSATFGDDINSEVNLGTYSKEYTFTMNGAWNPKNVKITAFVANYDKNNANNCVVYNSEQINLANLIPEGYYFGGASVSTGNAGGSVTGSGFYKPNSTVTLKAKANTGYKFLGWTLDGTVVSTSADFTFTMPNQETIYTAKIERLYKVTVTTNNEEWGTVEGAGSYATGEEVTIKAIAEEDYKFENWTLNNKVVSSDAEYKFTMTAKAVKYVATFSDPNSVKDVENINVNIYPNPAKNNINIDGEFNSLFIYDITGKVVKKIENNVKIVDVSDLNNGIYIIKVTDDQGSALKKIMINR